MSLIFLSGRHILLYVLYVILDKGRKGRGKYNETHFLVETTEG